MGNVKDLTGMRFGKLLVIARGPNDSNGKATWKCRCDCGMEKHICSWALVGGLTKSCGCLRHGLRHTRLYTIWSHMQQRCENPKHNRYYLYGERGISICDEWRNDFITFYNWAIAHRYNDSLTIDRINPDGNYEPDNCRWVTVSEQNRNRRPYHHKNRKEKGVRT